MKKLLVVVAILVGADACGRAESAGSTAATSNGTTVAPQGGNLSAGGGATKTNGSGGGATTGGTTVPSQTVPTLQGPPGIRQAQLSGTVSSGAFASTISQGRTL